MPDEYTGAVVDLLSRRKGEMLNMSPVETGGDAQMTNIEYLVPTRGMIGLRNSMLTATRGTAVLDTLFDSYRPYAGKVSNKLCTWNVNTRKIITYQQQCTLFVSKTDFFCKTRWWVGFVLRISTTSDSFSPGLC